MLISYNWLKEFAAIEISPEELALRLPMLGLEVESITSSIDPSTGGQDFVLELGITPNRGDCLSVLGIAREAALIAGCGVELAPIELAESPPAIDKLAGVQILAPKLCPRYTARLIRNITVAPSPAWLAHRLTACGLRPINNVVDVTNYVMLELGHPLHAFDYKLLEQRQIQVRPARFGERLITLDGVERHLDEQALVIADARKPVALAGIMGGADTAVSQGTTDVLLECAYFDPACIRRTARRLGISSDSSYRFERGVDPQGLSRAIDRAAQLIQTLAGGEIAQGVIDIYPESLPAEQIDLRFSRVNRILGTQLTGHEITGITQRLGFAVMSAYPDKIRLQVPGYRHDIGREIDIIEEIARLWGYDKIPTVYPASCVSGNIHNPLPSLENQARSLLMANGFWEVVNFSFTREEQCYKIIQDEVSGERPETERESGEGRLSPNGGCLELRNPLTQEQQVLRSSLLPSLLQNAAQNYQESPDIKLFELAAVYTPAQGDFPQEHRLLSAVMIGNAAAESWGMQRREADFFDIKGMAEAILEDFGLKDTACHARSGYLLGEETGGVSAQVECQGQILGYLGQISRDATHKFDLEVAVFGFELDFGKLISLRPAGKTYQPLPKHPAIKRDIALVVTEDVPARRVEQFIRENGQPWLESAKLFDVYVGQPLAKGYKSLAFSLSYRSPERTLTDEDIDPQWKSLIRKLEDVLNAKLR